VVHIHVPALALLARKDWFAVRRLEDAILIELERVRFACSWTEPLIILLDLFLLVIKVESDVKLFFILAVIALLSAQDLKFILLYTVTVVQENQGVKGPVLLHVNEIFDLMVYHHRFFRVIHLYE